MSEDKEKKGFKDHLKKHLKDRYDKSLADLTEDQIDVLIKLSQGMPVKKISSRRGTSPQAVYELMKKLREKGYPIDHLKKGTLKQGGYYTSTPGITGEGQIRLHAQRFKIQAPKSSKYEEKRSKADFISIKGCKVYLHRDSIEVICNPNLSFYGSSADEALNNSWKYWLYFFNLLENDLGVVLLKDRKHNIKQTLAHYARIESDLAEGVVDNGLYRVKASEDGKTWLLFDMSKSFEDETVHADTAKPDREFMDVFLNDLRDDYYSTNEYVRISDLKSTLFLLTKETKQLGMGLNSVVKVLEMLLPDRKDLERQEGGEFDVLKTPEYIG